MKLNDESPSNAAHWHKRATEAEAEATKQVMRASAAEWMTMHFRAALEKIAYHDYGQLRPPFDPQEVAIEALKKAGVYED